MRSSSRTTIRLATAFRLSSTRPINSCGPLTTNGGRKPQAAEVAQQALTLDDLLDNGQGVGRAGGLVAFVSGGLPGERVRVAVDAVKRNYVSAHAVDIERRSPDRIESVCPVFPECGGCQVLHLRYEAQLEWKRRMLRDALARLGGLPDAVVDVTHPTVGMPGGYRNKVSLVPKFGSGPTQLGLYAARSHRVVPIDHCPVLIPRLDRAVRALVSLAADDPALFAGTRHVVARASATSSQLVVSMNGDGRLKPRAAGCDAIRSQIPELTGLTCSWEFENENALFGRRFATLWGSPLIRENVAGVQLSFGIASFFQINTSVLDAIAQRLLGALAGSGRVVDLYCGVGTFGVALGSRGIPSTGVEWFRPAVEEAVANAAANGVTCAAFECASAVDATRGERGRTLLSGADAVILDPPRKGCEPEVIAALGARGPARIEYVSCNPATLARDAKALAAAGYRLSRATPFDMFPQTGHVEALAEFER